jgi:hypothetical protein
MTKAEMKRRGYAEWKHVESHEQDYVAAYLRAMLCIKGDRRFVGLDLVRDTLAHEAALCATGFEDKKYGFNRPLRLPDDAGEPTPEFLEMCEQMLAVAKEAALPRLAAE